MALNYSYLNFIKLLVTIDSSLNQRFHWLQITLNLNIFRIIFY